jgi:hypothetical protein
MRACIRPYHTGSYNSACVYNVAWSHSIPLICRPSSCASSLHRPTPASSCPPRSCGSSMYFNSLLEFA